MPYFAIAAATILVIVGSWQHNLYAFLFGCSWLIASAILAAADTIVSSMERRAQEDLKVARENLGRLMRERSELGESVGRAINVAAASANRKRGA